jgi:hypothetical protein
LSVRICPIDGILSVRSEVKMKSLKLVIAAAFVAAIIGALAVSVVDVSTAWASSGCSGANY